MAILAIIGYNKVSCFVVDPDVLSHYLNRVLVTHIEAIIAAEYDLIGTDQSDQVAYASAE